MDQEPRYDPQREPGAWWNELSEDERLELVVSYHRRERIRLPNPSMHALAHVIVENQIALGDETPIQGTLRRLVDEGLDRHEAVHAIGATLMGIFWEVGTERLKADPTPKYYEELGELTAEKWLSQAE